MVSMSCTIAASLGRRQQPVGPVALVEHADVHERLAVEQQPLVPLGVRPDPEGPQPGVRRHPVLAQGDLDVVEVRVLGRPRVHLGQRDQRRHASATAVADGDAALRDDRRWSSEQRSADVVETTHAR